MELREKVINLLKESEPMKGGEIAEALSTDKKEIDKVIKKLKDEEIVISPKRCFYSITK